MDSLLIHNASIVTPRGLRHHGWVLVQDGRIADTGWEIEVSPPPDADISLFPLSDTDAPRIDAGGLTLLPGFIDLHVHGAMGHDTMDADPKGLRAMARFYAQHGVTGFLATTWTDSRERIYAAMQAAAAVQKSPAADGAALLGVHMEGPYLNPAYCGAQNPDQIRRADRDEMAALFELGVIRLVSLAPEYEENHWLIGECRRRGIMVSLAHSAATYAQVREAVERGIGHSTHTFNAMTGLHHREPGAVGAILTTRAIRAELIADNIHVHPIAMDVLWKYKGVDGVILITDAIRAAGLPDGEYDLDGRMVTLKDGACRLADGTLAGSVLTMNEALRNFFHTVLKPVDEFWQVSSYNAACAIGLEKHKGRIEAGYDADLVLIDPEFEVHYTIVGGRIVYRKGT